MTKFISFLAPHLNAYREFCYASNRWSAHTESILRIFDRYCSENHADSENLTQEIISEWCKERASPVILVAREFTPYIHLLSIYRTEI